MTQPLDETEQRIREAIEALGKVVGLGATSQADWERFNARYASRRDLDTPQPLPQRIPGKFAEDPTWT